MAALNNGKMQTMAKMTHLIHELNPTAEVIGNPLIYCKYIDSGTPYADWDYPLQFYDGGFDEQFGSFQADAGYPSDSASGDWEARYMQVSFEAVINASTAGKTVIIHAYPGPAGVITGMFQPRGDVANKNAFHIAEWAGPLKVPIDPEDVRNSTRARLVESLAPFLIVANEHVFFGYGWWYQIEDGYIPCPKGVECGMPSEWYDEFTRPLGPPDGPATHDESGMIWTRGFKHCKVYVDLRDRTASKITWFDDIETIETRAHEQIMKLAMDY